MALKYHTKRSRPRCEALEARQLLASGENAFAQFQGSAPAPGGSDTVTLNVLPSDFTMPGGRVLLGFAMQAGGSGQSHAQMSLGGIGRSHARVILDSPGAGGSSALMLGRVGKGAFQVQMSQPGSTGPFQLNVFLAGDVNGDHRVDRTDLKMIRALLGKTQNDAGFVLAADPDGDGRIGMRDWLLARSNLGAATQVRPLAVSLGVSAASDPDGNGVVIAPTIVVGGTTAPGARVTLDQGATGKISQVTIADAQGAYHFQVSTSVGITPLVVTAADAFGQSASTSRSIRHGDVIIDWNQTMLEAIRNDKTTLGLTTRTLAMVQAAMYDAVNDIERTYAVYKVDVQAQPAASPQAAAAEAAYDVLLALYPKQKSLLGATLAESLASVPPGQPLRAGIAVGDAVAQGMLAWRQNDGSSVIVPYVPGTQPGQWRPTPPDFSAPWGPEWGQVTPFALPNPAQFQPPPPPALTSAAYASAYNEVKSVGALNSTTRTPYQTQTALFWAYDAPPFGPPPVHYDQVLQDVALEQGNSFEQNARLFALVNIAMADAGIVTWDAKFTDNFWRPVTAIPLAGTDGNPNTIPEPNWVPLGAPANGLRADFTPPFPAYVSGHAAFGAALFQTLADFYGSDNIPFTTGSDQVPGVLRTYQSFSQAAEENGQSRIYMGIHWHFDKVEGIATGNNVANYIFQNDLKPVS